MSALRPVDAAPTPGGDGLVERVITDAALWADVQVPDPPDARAEGDGGGPDGGGGDGRGSDEIDLSGGGSGCALLATTACAARQACYPFPFEGPPTGETRCAFQGAGGPAIPCQSQLECDGTTLCTAPGEADSVCLPRCDRADPRCAVGTVCVAYRNHPGVGICL
ncbi:MAG: hypothetical protein ABUS79_15580 [Pseudomonadota bacterium]